MSFYDILQWWNIIYAAPLVVSLVWIVATVLSGAHGVGSHGHVQADHGLTHDIGHGISHAAHDIGHAASDVLHHGHVGADGADSAHAGQHDVQAPNGHAHTHAHGGPETDSLMWRVLLVLGFGKVPITLTVGIFMLFWGVLGLLANSALANILKYPAVYFVPSLWITLISTLFVTRLMIAFIGRVMPGTETFGITRFEMVGSIGHTVYPVSENAGTVNISDTYGTVHRVQAKTGPAAEPIPAGTEVIAVDFDEQDKRFVVVKSDL